jgi:uncharacterized hydrophobic protein (TIGR00271 family)
MPTYDDQAANSPLRNLTKFPRLTRDDRITLVERTAESAVCDWDFIMMMLLSTALASLGLLQGSTAVVIGAMLVAPLMGPLVAGGLALTQGNPKLMRTGFGTTVIGIGIGLGVSILVGLINPGFEPSMEIEARGEPDLLDLGIAFASGMAGAYALGRPKVAATLAGVAIAAALVPPLAVVGIALVNGRPIVSGFAAILLMTNVIAIMLGAGLVFRLLGVRTTTGDSIDRTWERRAVVLLVMAALLLTAPLFMNMLEKQRKGIDRPLVYAVSPAVREAVHAYVDEHEHVELLSMGRTSVEPQTGVLINLAIARPLHTEFRAELTDIVQDIRGETVPVKINVLLREDALDLLSGPAAAPDPDA